MSSAITFWKEGWMNIFTHSEEVLPRDGIKDAIKEHSGEGIIRDTVVLGTNDTHNRIKDKMDCGWVLGTDT